MLAELKVADQVNRREMHSVFRKNEWVSMITLRPSRGLSLDDYIGSLAAGKKADITILRKRARDANKSLMKNSLGDVEMVWVGGRLLYGDQGVVDQICPGACEPLTVDGVAKGLCVADPESIVPSARETFSQLDARIRAAYPGHASLVH
jgi:adenine deaminase